MLIRVMQPKRKFKPINLTFAAPVCADITGAVYPDEAAGTSAIVRVDFWRATGELSESYEVKLSAHPEKSEHTGFGQGLYVAIGDWTLKYARSATSEALEGGIVEVKLERGRWRELHERGWPRDGDRTRREGPAGSLPVVDRRGRCGHSNGHRHSGPPVCSGFKKTKAQAARKAHEAQ